MLASIALQCRQQPGSFTKQGETMGFEDAWPGHLKKHQHPELDLSQIEWMSDQTRMAVP